MSIVLLLQMMEDGIGDRWVIYFRRWEGEQGGYHLIVCLLFSCIFVFCYLTFSIPLFRWLEQDGCCVCFFVFFFDFFISGPFECMWIQMRKMAKQDCYPFCRGASLQLEFNDFFFKFFMVAINHHVSPLTFSFTFLHVTTRDFTLCKCNRH